LIFAPVPSDDFSNFTGFIHSYKTLVISIKYAITIIQNKVTWDGVIKSSKSVNFKAPLNPEEIIVKCEFLKS
jgi:hypothetical protein